MTSPAGRPNVLAIVPQPGQPASGTALPGPPSPTKALIDRLSFLAAKKLEAGPQATKQKAARQQQDSSSDDDEDYPPDAQQCTVSGPGFAGGASGAPTKMVIHVKDSRGKRLKSGGEDVSCRIQFSSTSEYLPVEVNDNDDGTYTAVYTPPSKGNYQVTVEVNGIPIAGSPFPVFFSAPLDPATLAAQQAAQESDAPKSGLSSEPTTNAEHYPPTVTHHQLLQPLFGDQRPEVLIPSLDEHLRTLYVGNISPLVPIERLKELFGHFGNVLEMTIVGDRKDMAVVVFSTKEAQQQGQQLNNTQFGDRPLAVTAPMTAMASGVVPANPQLAMQMQQIQQMQQTLIQSQKLAAQVAQMRAYNKTGVVLREDPQKAAQEAAARIASKLAGTGSRIVAELAAAGASAAAAAANANASANASMSEAALNKQKSDQHHVRKSSRSRSRSPRRRSRSRSRDRNRRNYRDDYGRSRDRDRHERERRERERRDQELRERERERERQRARDRDRDRDRQRDNRDRDRGNDKDRGKDKDKDMDKGTEKDSKKDRGRGRDSSRDRKERHRSRSTSREGRGKDRGRDGSADRERNSRRDEERPDVDAPQADTQAE